MGFSILSSKERILATNQVKVRGYLHMEKFALVNALEEMGIDLSDPVIEELAYAFYEIEVDAWVDLVTGNIELDGCQ